MSRFGEASGVSDVASGVFFRWRDWLFAAALVVAVFLAYQPAWRASFVWDDNAHITRPEMCSWHGLYRIWFELTATQQYYPLLHSAFWVEQRLWDGNPLYYHLANILLHATVALMAALILRRLAIPGAYLAAAIFALHPVCVESVAWVTEQKNTLSAVFYLGAMMAYLRFDRVGGLGTGPFFGGKTSLANRPSADNMGRSPSGGRQTRFYVAALGLFVLALLSKTVTATLPAALLVIFWWQRGRLLWRRDVLPLVPFFTLGAISGVFTAWVECKVIGAEGAEFELTIIERLLIAGRVVWFYLGKLFWPANLMFIYPRWRIDSAARWQYLYPAATLALVAALWLLRRRWRGPLAGVLFFFGTLFPVLGFFNVYPFIFSFVADHFQYLASLGIITLTSAGIAVLLTRWRLWNQSAGNVFCLALLATLATLTWRQSRLYVDIDTLYRKTVAVNPECWVFHNNLGQFAFLRGKTAEAMAYYRRALEIYPECPDAWANLGIAVQSQRRLDEAIGYYQRALKARPIYAAAEYAYGTALEEQGKIDEAMAHFEKALKIKPDHPKAHHKLGVILARRGYADEALTHFREAVKARPDFVDAWNGLGIVLAGRGELDEAIACFQKALKIKPDYAEARSNLELLRRTHETPTDPAQP